MEEERMDSMESEEIINAEEQASESDEQDVVEAVEDDEPADVIEGDAE